MQLCLPNVCTSMLFVTLYFVVLLIKWRECLLALSVAESSFKEKLKCDVSERTRPLIVARSNGRADEAAEQFPPPDNRNSFSN